MGNELFWDKKSAVDKPGVYAQTVLVDIHKFIHRPFSRQAIFFAM